MVTYFSEIIENNVHRPKVVFSNINTFIKPTTSDNAETYGLTCEQDFFKKYLHSQKEVIKKEVKISNISSPADDCAVLSPPSRS